MNDTLLASAERTETTNSDVQRTPGDQRGAMLILDITSAPATEETLTLSIQVRDPATGKFVTLTSFGVTAKGSELESGATLGFTLYPGALETAAVSDHEVQGLPLPSSWRVVVTHSGEGKWTYSLGASALR